MRSSFHPFLRIRRHHRLKTDDQTRPTDAEVGANTIIGNLSPFKLSLCISVNVCRIFCQHQTVFVSFGVPYYHVTFVERDIASPGNADVDRLQEEAKKKNQTTRISAVYVSRNRPDERVN
ncbi:hypothetical protein EVAR_51798_1 [Eumeta japonica]|uniref:Uncharacterized protein n=1 Tax=Eumeta variegata TaxID=151549 RepID=A0A4C2A7P0_EUMVA|nr:hypothetical protein EVAR_51798_1 [Eumeta japonica]